MEASDTIAQQLLKEMTATLEAISTYRDLLYHSPKAELDALVRGLNGGYIAPSPRRCHSLTQCTTHRRNLTNQCRDNPEGESNVNTGKELADQNAVTTYLAEHAILPYWRCCTFG